MKKTLYPLIVALSLAIFLLVGIMIGERRASAYSGLEYVPQSDAFGETEGGISSSEASTKLTYLFDLLRDRYVDSLDLKGLVEDAIPVLVEELDPHSNYIPASDLEEVNEQLDGSFSGIGVQFNIQQDTVMVIQVIAGGPSEKAGVMAGDRIVTVDDSTFCGKGISNDRVLKTLRGPKGSKVKLGIRRASADELLEFEFERGDIPVKSVVANYLVDSIGYIRIDNFGRNTYQEFFTSLLTLRSRGAKGFLIDLRGNGGGYLEVCIAMVNEFLPKGSLIVYTEGRSQQRQDVYADGRGNFQQLPVVVMIDDWSASASEIFSGAMQDNDRATIVGRRSFGKGLVQQQYELNDGSALRLTVARYYTPSGRCIQKPYEMGEREKYLMDVVERYNHGEFYNQDSIHLADSLRYETVGGRAVYAGGGIMPDIFVPGDTSYVTPYYNRCVNSGVIYSFAFQYSDRHREELGHFKSFDEMEKYLRKRQLLSKFVEYANPKVKADARSLARSGREIECLIMAYVMRQSGYEDYFYQMFNSNDKTYLRGLQVIRDGQAWPKINP
ncbi:MAG: S41 family peptidase [Bacteroidales bacterium]|jgi:carboxyl-terminal processing protease|nr:S41 family peptidase [Bacteroidales bacterium]